VVRKKRRKQQATTSGDVQNTGAMLQRALELHRQQHLPAAEQLYREVLALEPKNANALHLLGLIHAQRDDHYQAIELYNQAILIDSAFAGSYNNRGISFNSVGEYRLAMDDFKHSLMLSPSNPDGYNNLGNTLNKLGRVEAAITAYEKALMLNPQYVDGYYNLACSFNKLRRYADAICNFKRVLAINPNHLKAFSNLALALRHSNDWAEYIEFEARMLVIAKSNSVAFKPFHLLLWSDDPELQLAYVSRYAQHEFPLTLKPFSHEPSTVAEKIRVGYISTDFRDHAVAQLTAELFELHDREKFEVFGFALGAKDSGVMRKRLENGFDHFIEIGYLGDSQAAELINEQGIHILVDLNGYTSGARTHIMAMRPAPIQVSYIGYIGTMGAEFIDYILVDKHCVPDSLQPCFTEKLVQLPCYMVNDRKRTIAASSVTRAEVGLPDEGFVFCCFNNNCKITPSIFDIWMRCLDRVPGSVLWMVGDSEVIEKNLRHEASLRGIAPARLIFSPRTRYAEHLARQPLADLFLDTLPYNAGATASDALWGGLPVLTCQGKSFAGRMCGSLLQAVGLPELVVGSLVEYEAMAIKLATEPALLRVLRKRLVDNRDSSLLFDSERFCRSLEQAYQAMMEEKSLL